MGRREREREKDIVRKEARERRGDRRGVYIYIPGKERGQEADEVESFKRLRTRGSRCELGWRVCGIGVMGQLVSYRGSSVRGTERYSDCARRHRARVARREREIYIYMYIHGSFPRRRVLSCLSSFPFVFTLKI